MVIASATRRARRGQAGPVVDEQALVAAVADPGDHAERAQRGEGVGDQVEEHRRLRARRRPGPMATTPISR